MGNIVTRQAFLPPYPPSPIYREVFYLATAKTRCRIPVLQIDVRAPRFSLIFSHGNAEDLGGIQNWMQVLAERLQVQVFAYDYPGYGFSSAEKPEFPVPACSESLCYEAIEAVYDHVTQTQKVPPSSIVVMGRSLGTGPTTHIASKRPVAGVILQSPLLSAIRVVMNTWFTLPIDIFANQDKIHKIKAPIFIAHGTQDEVIESRHGMVLHSLIPKEYAYEPWWIQGAGHNDIEYSFFDEWLVRINTFLMHLESLSQTRAQSGKQEQ